MPLSEDEVRELRELDRTATPGPWQRELDRNEQENIYGYDHDEWIALLPHQCVAPIEKQRAIDANFIVTARTALPRLLDERDELRAVVGELLATVQQSIALIDDPDEDDMESVNHILARARAVLGEK